MSAPMADLAFADVPAAEDVVASAEAVATAIEAGAVQDADMAKPAGSLAWSCGETLAHMCDAVGWYAANLARRSTTSSGYPDAPTSWPVADLVDVLRSAAAVLAAVVRDAALSDRGHHSWGVADRSGFAAMGCDEILVHGYDLAQGLGFEFSPPAQSVERTLRRLFPWAPGADEADPWDALLWANGRIPLGDRPPETKWLWHCAPLNDWNGEIRRWKPRN
ncbi:MAG TPA: hypothetical protein VMY88_10950 [Acidimicrobiales bacterium]|nr:hypothetical protein [Acidimicrobiales bacterium]